MRTKTFIAISGLAGLISCDPNILEPNMEQRVTKDSTYSPQDTTFGKDTTIIIPVQRNDLSMSLQLNKAIIGDTLEYTSILQVLGDTITINNGEKLGDKRAMRYTIYKNGQFYADREDESNIILSLFDNGFVKQETEGDSIKGTITNAKVWARIYHPETGRHDTIEATIPSPITVSWKTSRSKIDDEIIKESGIYNVNVDIDYSIKDNLYHSLFISEPFNIGLTTGVNRTLENRLLKMERVR